MWNVIFKPLKQMWSSATARRLSAKGVFIFTNDNLEIDVIRDYRHHNSHSNIEDFYFRVLDNEYTDPNDLNHNGGIMNATGYLELNCGEVNSIRIDPLDANKDIQLTVFKFFLDHGIVLTGSNLLRKRCQENGHLSIEA